MCGIAGIVNLDGLTRPEQDSLERMVAVQRHRGPDGSGTFVDTVAALGHARLSIIDLAAGHQPMCNEDESIWISFNGEIYNFRELRQELIARGHRFKTHCDTEVILHLYEEEGDRCVERLRGMFAFAIWDQNRRRLLLARDPLGIKPLYYAVQGNRLLFGSEIKVLREAPDCPADVDTEALQDYLTYTWIPGPKSIFRGIRKLQPGHFAVFDSHGFATSEYWDVDYSHPAECPEQEYVHEFRSRLAEAVNMRLIADVPLGAFLSGGLDSSSVVATMAGLRAEPVITNSIGFEEREFNELHFADRVAERLKTDHHRRIVRPDALEILPKLAWHWDEPFADSSAIPTYYVSEMARERVTVALSGDGGDENLAGYRKYKFNHRQRLVRRWLPAPVRRGVFAPLARLYPKADWLPRMLRARSTFEELSRSDLDAIYLSRAAVHPAVVQRLLSPELKRDLAGYDSRSVLQHHYERCNSADPLHREMYVDIKTYLADDILTKVDRASMAVGLEVRVPLLDSRFVQFMAGIPSHWKLRGGCGKYLLKEAFRPQLGADITDRRKMGFSIPLNDWLRGPLREVVEETVFSNDAYVRQWLDMQQLRQIWTAHLRGISRMETVLWAVLMLEQWSRQFLGSRRASSDAAVLV